MSTYRKLLGVQWSRDRWCHVTPRGQGHDCQNWDSISQQSFKLDGPFKLTTYRKPHIASPVVTWQMSLRDPRSQYRWSSISRQPCEIDARFKLTTYKKPHIAICESSSHATDDVTWPQKSRSWPKYLWTLISQKLCEIGAWFKLTTNRKPHIRSPVFMWPITSRDPKGQHRDRKILVSWQPCKVDGCSKLTKPYITNPVVTWPMMSLVANGDSWRLVVCLQTNNGCKILTSE